MDKEKAPLIAEQNHSQSTLVLTREKEEAFIVCEVCGHANSEKAAICKMCSNYLEEMYYGKRIR